MQWLRLVRRGGSIPSSTFLLVGKFAEAWGMVKFHLARLRGLAGPIIEYK